MRLAIIYERIEWKEKPVNAQDKYFILND